MCKCYIVISDTLVASFLDVLFLLLAVILSHRFMTNQEGKIELQKKVHRRICVKDITCLTARSPFYVFLLLSSSPHSLWRTCGMAPIKIYIYTYLLLWVVFCVMISWVNCWKHERRYENISYNLILHGFLYKQRFFSTHPQCCLAFSRIGLQMLLRCGLIHITIIIHFTFYIWYIVSMSMPRSIKQTHLFFI